MKCVDVTLLVLAAVHFAFGLACIKWIYTADQYQKISTHRVQFSNWKNLLDLYRLDIPTNGTTALSVGAIRENAWCNFTLPPHTVYPPFCACVTDQYHAYAARNITSTDAIARTVGCLRYRSTWRVFTFWSMHPATPVFYVMMVCGIFLVVAVRGIPSLGILATWTTAVVTIVVLSIKDAYINFAWCVLLVTASLIVHLVFVPALEKPVMSNHRYDACFWFAEFFISPVYIMYMPIFNGSRDMVLSLVLSCLGGLLGSFGLRSFWFSVMFKKTGYVNLLRWVLWIGILLLSGTFIFLSGILYQSSDPDVMTVYSVGCAAVTCLIGILQIPFPLCRDCLFSTQVALAVVRNVFFASVVLIDVGA